jgi:flagellar motility protein MotE (MotC chaperone)
MGLFNKKKEVKKEAFLLPELPKFPELPKLDYEEGIHRVPRFPSDSPGTEFSSDTIKEAGGKEDELPANEFPDEDEMRMMQEPLRKPLTEEIGEEGTSRLKRMDFGKERNITEPVFIRIDWFEEALKIFNETKKKISEIERVLEDIKKVKEKEENELKTWENEIRTMKEQIEKVDKDIFSKIK